MKSKLCLLAELLFYFCNCNDGACCRRHRTPEMSRFLLWNDAHTQLLSLSRRGRRCISVPIDGLTGAPQ